jgi:hypothetical protein
MTPDDIAASARDWAIWLTQQSSVAGTPGEQALPPALAARFTDEKRYFVSESSVYRLLKAHDLITSRAYLVIKAANEFRDKTTAINQMWQTDFTNRLTCLESSADGQSMKATSDHAASCVGRDGFRALCRNTTSIS